MIKATVGDALIVGGRITSIKTIDAGKILITIDHDKKVEFRNNGKKNRADIVKRLDLKKPPEHSRWAAAANSVSMAANLAR